MKDCEINILQLLEGSSFSNEVVIEISKKLIPITLNKKEFFVNYGERMNKLGILFKGTLVSRYSNEKGKETASKFYFPKGDNIVGDYKSFKNKFPSEEAIQAIEKSILLTLNQDDFKFLIDKYPSLQEQINQLAEDSYFKALDRIRDFQMLNAFERVKKFNITNSSIVSKLLVKDKASYLGMTRNVFTNNMKKI